MTGTVTVQSILVNLNFSRENREEERRDRDRIPAGNSRIPIPKSRPGQNSTIYAYIASIIKAY